MTDLTVLVSPNPLYPVMGNTNTFSFGLRSSPKFTHRPVMITLERDIDPEEAAAAAADRYKNIRGENESRRLSESSSNSSSSRPSSPASLQAPLSWYSAPSPRRPRNPQRTADAALLSPPINTWKSPDSEFTRRSRPGHRSTRSRSAPPGKTEFEVQQERAFAQAKWEADASTLASASASPLHLSFGNAASDIVSDTTQQQLQQLQQQQQQQEQQPGLSFGLERRKSQPSVPVGIDFPRLVQLQNAARRNFSGIATAPHTRNELVKPPPPLRE